jgi:hypothetical protein
VFERGFRFANDVGVKFSGRFAEDSVNFTGWMLWTLMWLCTRNHGTRGNVHLVRRVLKLCGNQKHAGQRQSGIGLGRRNERITRRHVSGQPIIGTDRETCIPPAITLWKLGLF